MYNENEISLTEATVLALQGKLKLEETKSTRRTKRKIESTENESNKEVKEESVNINTDDVNVSVDDNGDTIVDTANKTITVSEKTTENPFIEEPVEDQETIDVPVEGDETIVPEEEVSEETVEDTENEDIEDLELDESKKVENKNGFSNKVKTEAIEDKEETKCENCGKEVCECDTIEQPIEESKECLVEEEPKYEWVLQGNYGYGWDDLVTYDSKEEAQEDYKTYREEEPEFAHRIRKRLVKVEAKCESKEVKTRRSKKQEGKIYTGKTLILNDGTVLFYVGDNNYGLESYETEDEKIHASIGTGRELWIQLESGLDDSAVNLESEFNEVFKIKNDTKSQWILVTTDYGYKFISLESLKLNESKEVKTEELNFNLSSAVYDELNLYLENIMSKIRDNLNEDTDSNYSEIINKIENSIVDNQLKDKLLDIVKFYSNKDKTTNISDYGSYLAECISSLRGFLKKNINKTEVKEVKTETKYTFNKKSFEEALTKFYNFNDERVKSFKVESIARNKKGSVKIEGKLNNKVSATMIFDKVTEGKSFITYKLKSTNNILKESKEIKTSMTVLKKENTLKCRSLISK